MKKQLTIKKEKNLKLGKIDISKVPAIMARNQQHEVKGGYDTGREGTAVPIFCKP